MKATMRKGFRRLMRAAKMALELAFLVPVFLISVTPSITLLAVAILLL
jgi:hypothetical protein